MQKQMKQRGFPLWVFFLLTFFFLFMIFFSFQHIFLWKKENQKIEQLSKEIQEEITLKTVEEQGQLIHPLQEESDYWSYVKLPFYEVDFSKLIEKNKDTVAFIHLNNTNINYPVVQTTNNDYYLHHAFDQSKNEAGWIFLDYRNHLEQLSENTVIYGHGRLNQTVFGSLNKTLTKTWQENWENYAIWLSTPKENFLFQIFSIYQIPSESTYLKTTFTSLKEKQEWIKQMKKRNLSPVDVEVDEQDQILTLSTCTIKEGSRIVIHAKLIKKQERKKTS